MLFFIYLLKLQTIKRAFYQFVKSGKAFFILLLFSIIFI
ncbi:hypothetical protein BBG19_0326 [Francisella sp. MA067296]|nr:hypothetical protein BBG19_0326 [Francisella sp. MA067296]